MTIGSAFVVNSYQGPSMFAPSTLGNWYNQLPSNRVAAVNQTQEGNWLWDATVSSQTLNNGNLNLQCSAYRLLAGSPTLQLNTDTSIFFGYKLLTPHNGETVVSSFDSDQIIVQILLQAQSLIPGGCLLLLIINNL